MKITSDLTNLTTAILILTVQIFFEWILSVLEIRNITSKRTHKEKYKKITRHIT
jgi:hypothetical protein